MYSQSYFLPYVCSKMKFLNATYSPRICICNVFDLPFILPFCSCIFCLSYVPHYVESWKNLRDLGRNRSNNLNKAILPSDSSISFLASEALLRLTPSTTRSYKAGGLIWLCQTFHGKDLVDFFMGKVFLFIHQLKIICFRCVGFQCYVFGMKAAFLFR